MANSLIHSNTGEFRNLHGRCCVAGHARQEGRGRRCWQADDQGITSGIVSSWTFSCIFFFFHFQKSCFLPHIPEVHPPQIWQSCQSLFLNTFSLTDLWEVHPTLVQQSCQSLVSHFFLKLFLKSFLKLFLNLVSWQISEKFIHPKYDNPARAFCPSISSFS